MSEQLRSSRRQRRAVEEATIPVEESVEVTVSNTESNTSTVSRSFVHDDLKYDIHTQEGVIEYIRTAIELETDLVTQERIVAECLLNIKGRKPTLELSPIPDRPRGIDSIPSPTPFILGIFFIIIGIPMLIWSISVMQNDPIMIYVMVISVFLIWYAVKIFRDAAHEKRYNKEQFESYQRRRKDAVERNELIQQEYNQAVLEYDNSYRAIAEEFQLHLDETRSILSRLYSKGVIYPKYCNLPALTSIYEYYITGRCEELTGPNGAYNIYEDERRKDIVISQLNTVIENLEQIKQNQYILYEQVCAIQQNTSAIRNELLQIKGHTVRIAHMSTLNAYYASRTARYSRILMFYHL